MQNNSADPVARQRQRDRELRAAVDVMFEALSHIQASLETSTEEKRMESYKKFKEALYDRFEHLVEEREAAAQETTYGAAHADSGEAQNEPTLDDSDEEDDTLEKMWPAVAEKA